MSGGRRSRRTSAPPRAHRWQRTGAFPPPGATQGDGSPDRKPGRSSPECPAMPHHRCNRRISRRTLIGGAAAAGAAALPATAAAAKRHPKPKPHKADVIIVGAGLSGPDRARNVVKAGPLGDRARGPRPRRRHARSTTTSATRQGRRDRRSVDRADPGSPRGAGQGTRGQDVQDIQQRQLPVLRERQAHAVLAQGPARADPARPDRRRRSSQPCWRSSTRWPRRSRSRRRGRPPDAEDWDGQTFETFKRSQHARPGRQRACSISRSRPCSRASRATSRCCTSCSTSTRPATSDARDVRAADQHRRRRPGQPLRRRLAAGLDPARPRRSATG